MKWEHTGREEGGEIGTQMSTPGSQPVLCNPPTFLPAPCPQQFLTTLDPEETDINELPHTRAVWLGWVEKGLCYSEALLFPLYSAAFPRRPAWPLRRGVIRLAELEAIPANSLGSVTPNTRSPRRALPRPKNKLRFLWCLTEAPSNPTFARLSSESFS